MSVSVTEHHISLVRLHRKHFGGVATLRYVIVASFLFLKVAFHMNFIQFVYTGVTDRISPQKMLMIQINFCNMLKDLIYN